MRILILHNKYLIAGGEEVSTESEIDLLRKHGHTVDTIIIDNKSIDGISPFRLAIRTIWSRSTYKKLKAQLKFVKYDIVHVQNFFPLLSPSVFYAARSSGTKIIMSVRNYRLICPNALLFIDNEICTRCVGKTIPYPGVIKKCYRGSTLASLVTASMLSVHNILQTWNKKVDGFICISTFVKEQLILGGINEEILYTKSNFVAGTQPLTSVNKQYYLFVGRLSVEKGIDVMIEAFKQLGDRQLIIIGEGPLSAYVEKNAEAYENIKYLGRKSSTDTHHYMSEAKYLIFPSSWHEPFGRTIIEAFANGTPIIGSSVGGAKEIIKNGYNGFVFKVKDVGDLVRVIADSDKTDYDLLRKNARRSFEDKYTSEINYEKLISIYNKVLAKL